MKMTALLRLEASETAWPLPARALRPETSLAAGWPAGKPRVLLLQGPAGPFFRRLEQRLRVGGFDVRRVCFNAGDRLFAGGDGAMAFAGPIEAWPARIGAILRETRPDLVVLFGAERPLHKAVRAAARAAAVPVLCLEEGYVRPGWITAELDGNNAASPVAGQLPPADWAASAGAPEVGGQGGFRQACFYAAAYYGAQALRNTRRETGLLHRSVRASDAFFYARNAARKLAHGPRDSIIERRLTRRHSGRYVVVALQVPGDSQLAAAALGWNNERLVEEALSAFAAAPGSPAERLVFKIHPLNRGHTRIARVIRERAASLGLAESVDVLHCGSAATVIRNSAGLLTINSTAGFSAIFHGVPLVALGRALYSHPALAQGGGRESIAALFRGEVRAPDPGLRQRYLAWIRERCLLRGDFYSGRGAAEACDSLAERVAALCLPAFGRNEGTF